MFLLKINKVTLASLFAIFLFSSNFSSNVILSQISSNEATIIGKVSDADNGDALIGVTIYVEGTKLGAKTKVDGTYSIKKVPAGVYKLTFNYIGYQKKIVENVKVGPSESKKLNVILSADKVISEDVVVEAVRSNDNEAALLLQRKNSASVSDAISQEEISRLPDSDAGQSLKRVSGITLVDNKFVYVRGVSERYSNTTLNGASLTSTEPDKKAFSFDMFPSEFLQNITVNKSFTPDLPGNFAGGLVQLNTVDFPEGFSVKTSVSNSVNTNVNFVDNAVVGSPRSSTDWLGQDDGMRAAPSNIPVNSKAFSELRRNANDPNNTTGAAKEYESISKGFNGNNWKKETNTLGFLGNNGFGLSYTDLLDVFGNQFGIIGSVNYSTSNSRNNLNRNTFQSNLDTALAFNGFSSTHSVSLGGMLNMAYRLDNNNTISFKNVFNKSGDDEFLSLSGTDLYLQQDVKNFSYQYVEKEMYSGQLGGEHLISFDESIKTTLDWKAGYSFSTRDEPDLRRLRFARNLADIVSDPNTPYYADIQSTPQGSVTGASRFYSALNDEAYNANFNYTIPIDNTLKIKVGAWVENRTRTFNTRSFTIINQSLYGLNPEIESAQQDWQNPENIFQSENFRLDSGYQMSEDSKLSDSYTAKEELYAAYAMGDYSFDFFGESLRFIGGARIEDNTQSMNSFDNNNKELTVNRPITDILPSINLVWKATEKTNFRASASQTLTRPSLREFAPFAFFDFLQQALIKGNPSIKRALIQNYDLRYEYFPNIGEVVSASVFYKNFKNAIEETINPAASELERSFANSNGDAINYGIEFEFRKSLSFIDDYFEEFAIGTNIALINSEIEVLQGNVTDKRQMWGQSPYTVNVGLYYTNKDLGTSINVAYNTYGRRIIQVAQQGVLNKFQAPDPHVYELPRDLVDFSIIQPIYDIIEVKFAARDILNQSLNWEQAGRVMATNIRGANYSLGISYKMK